MIELLLNVHDNGSQKAEVIDHLVFVPSSYWKIDAFRICTGEKLVEGQKVSFEADDCIGRKGRAHIIVDTFEGRTKNKIGEYLPPLVGKGGGAVESAEPPDIPF